MRVAICGYPPIALLFQEEWKDRVEFKFFVRDFVSNRLMEGNELSTNLPLINFFEFRRLVDTDEIDGLIVVEDSRSAFTKEVVQICKLYDPNELKNFQ